ncbi:Aste57867_12089 [Aphanomyces stellatus]|uniref:Aste57867_12089 protein n=1 Tax=Aphanomyces stellatus TaxID=120398 RepID=A0A485KVF9_9STRA|nr:hypothetical protein As57867_012044 [Aphanomyces stellatus]VFT88944.1 Aste57867_12089 [Aphanomyces stellatus]
MPKQSCADVAAAFTSVLPPIMPVAARKSSQKAIEDGHRGSGFRRRRNSVVMDAQASTRWRSIAEAERQDEPKDMKDEVEFLKQVLTEDPSTRTDADILFQCLYSSN